MAIQVDRAMVRQALLNLALNAIDAMPSGGTLALRARSVEEQQVQIDVVDSGIGIEPEHLQPDLRPVFHDPRAGQRPGAVHGVSHGAAARRHDRSRVHSGPWRVVPDAVAPRMTMREGTLRRTSLTGMAPLPGEPSPSAVVCLVAGAGCARTKPVGRAGCRGARRAAAAGTRDLDAARSPWPRSNRRRWSGRHPPRVRRGRAVDQRPVPKRRSRPRPVVPESGTDAPATAAPEAAPAPATAAADAADGRREQRRDDGPSDVLGRATQSAGPRERHDPRPAGAPAARDGPPLRRAGASRRSSSATTCWRPTWPTRPKRSGEGPESLTRPRQRKRRLPTARLTVCQFRAKALPGVVVVLHDARFVRVLGHERSSGTGGAAAVAIARIQVCARLHFCDGIRLALVRGAPLRKEHHPPETRSTPRETAHPVSRRTRLTRVVGYAATLTMASGCRDGACMACRDPAGRK